ncbi:MAG TPA: hypothetical protein VMI72_07000 [Roseiarcus sp.]|nr:hypothetical protein [Roseiarcus sp.]
MRSKLIALLAGWGLAAIVAPALACDYHNTTAHSDQSSQQTAQAAPDAGSN